MKLGLFLAEMVHKIIFLTSSLKMMCYAVLVLFTCCKETSICKRSILCPVLSWETSVIVLITFFLFNCDIKRFCLRFINYPYVIFIVKSLSIY